MKNPVHSLWIAPWLACVAMPAVACERIPLASPTRMQTLADLQPTLVWRGDSDARYRVQVAAVLPEARLLALHDVEVAGTHWRLPEPLSVPRASIKVLISRQCHGLDTQDLLAQGPWFFVDVRGGCAIDPVSFEATASGLRWAPVAQAQRYSVRVFELGDAKGGEPLKLQAENEVQEPRWPIGGGRTGQPAVLSIQALCNGQWGRPAAWRMP